MATKNPPARDGDAGVEKEFFGSRDDHAEGRSVSSRDRLRGQLQDEVEKFLSQGGKIDRVDPHVTADPPKKPNSSYGSRPI
ncbi:hypothetical protein FKG94_20780 [Exilibacterium tricleocarpae]|uniref:Transcriptional regulator SutA RNAP-binding domain-containing protein n=1 Tax=Exilibacterium tricleocarpae TaxID=2591008 RepID=A0A545T0M0_9GAMM|nr:hypothetical protein [Exilibacterium tricleocarpae]TQV70764.1 hypothetical protein FKG94_20780 [Exilibacterium tricleocarpae]